MKWSPTYPTRYAASDALTAFDLTPQETRDLLDARPGRHVADDLSFIPGGPMNAEAIEVRIMRRLADRDWRSWFEEAIGIQAPRMS